MKEKILLLIAIIVTIITVTGCSTPAPTYSVSIPNLQTLRDANLAQVAVGEVTATGSAANNESISVRANSMVSPQGTFAKYLQNALVQELSDARLLDPKSDIKITAVLLKNDISAGGFITNSAEMEVQIAVSKAAQKTFDKVKKAKIEWDSNFIGAIAIPRAMQNYPRLVETLLKELYADKDFLSSLKK
jgi:uncharacterized lipoprotein YajG